MERSRKEINNTKSDFMLSNEKIKYNKWNGMLWWLKRE
jgi:hypothetical protein